jgi:hypothetical protein
MRDAGDKDWTRHRTLTSDEIRTGRTMPSPKGRPRRRSKEERLQRHQRHEAARRARAAERAEAAQRQVVRRRLRSSAIGLGIVGTLAAGFAACSSPDYHRYCTDAAGRRIADSNCGSSASSGGGYRWYYTRSGSRTPKIGEPVSGGSYSVPARGGFGGHGTSGGG